MILMAKSLHPDELAPGCWMFGHREGRPVILVSCPGCGMVASLCDHHILRDGEVTPSVVCTSCSFDDHVHLDAYEKMNS